MWGTTSRRSDLPVIYSRFFRLVLARNQCSPCTMPQLLFRISSRISSITFSIYEEREQSQCTTYEKVKLSLELQFNINILYSSRYSMIPNSDYLLIFLRQRSMYQFSNNNCIYIHNP